MSLYAAAAVAAGFEPAARVRLNGNRRHTLKLREHKDCMLDPCIRACSHTATSAEWQLLNTVQSGLKPVNTWQIATEMHCRPLRLG